ncbi:MAG TPA: alpha/beta hydrolase [Thermomicrobiales bacterium]|nr:alpha/beta hydrolase [Thermomicrobiales bacterium]
MTTRFLLDSGIPYGEGNGIPLLMDTLVSAHASGAPRPAVIFVHGGGWEAGDREAGVLFSMLLAKRGFFTATVGYRLSQVATWPAQIHDVKAAIRYVRAHAAALNVDPARIGIWGASAGGHLAAMAALNGDYPELEGSSGSPGHSSRVQCAVPICPPTDFTVPWRHLDGTEATDEEFGPVTRLLGALPRHVPHLARLASPAALAEPGDAPMLILHGTADAVVPFDQAERLLAAAQDAGNEAALLTMPGVGHEAGNHLMPDHADPYGTKAAAIAFFTRHLGPVPPA